MKNADFLSKGKQVLIKTDHSDVEEDTKSLKDPERLEPGVFQKKLDHSIENTYIHGELCESENAIKNMENSFGKMLLKPATLNEDSLEKNDSAVDCTADLNHKLTSMQGYRNNFEISSMKNIKDESFQNTRNYRNKQFLNDISLSDIYSRFIYQKNYDEYSTLSMFISYVVRHNISTPEELLWKEKFRLFLSEILHSCRPSAKLVLFGSMANGLAIMNSDMDFCVMDDSLDLHTDEFPKLLAEEIRKHDMEATLIFRTRISIIKVNSKGSRMFPEGIACDIGFNNKLAICNTNLLGTYSKYDHRVRKIILFVKYWAKRRKINDPYHGTLSSYGYVLLVLHYLINIVPVPLLPNLQRMKAAPGRPVVQSDIECDGFNVWFFKDIDTSQLFSYNTDSLGKLVHGFFYYYAYQFNWRDHVVSIRSKFGLLTKSEKGWTQPVERVSVSDKVFKDRYVLAIEDPFEITHNVGRTVIRQNAHMIRGEFFRASKISGLNVRKKIYEELCQERTILDNAQKTI